MKSIFNNPFSRIAKTTLALFVFTLVSFQSMAGIKIDIHIELGRRSLDCDKFSICHWSNTTSDRINASIENTGKALVFTIDNSAFVGHDGIIQNGYFIMEEECPISDTDKKTLGLPATATLRAGKYKALKTDKGYVINIPF